MDGNDSAQIRTPRRWLRIEFWVVLGVMAASQALLNLLLLVGPDDTENLESTLAYVAAGQLVHGPSSLYGPYGSGHLRVLIQAPLYYRLTALGAWPLVAGGMPPVDACVVTGRALSLISFLGLLVLVFRISRLDGEPRRAGAWAVLLVASSAVVGTSPVTLRPDLLGIFLQTLGGCLVLGVLCRPQEPSRKLSLAYVAFGLAVCMKQHLVATAAACTLLLLGFWFRTPAWRRSVERALLMGLIVAASYFLLEDLISAGRMSNSIVFIPKTLRETDRNQLFHLLGMTFEVLLRCVGMLVLAASVAWAARKPDGSGRLDRALWLFFVMEAGVFGFVCYGNEGAWINYGIPTVTYGSILLARSLSRTVEVRLPLWRAMLLATAAVVALGLNLELVVNKTFKLQRQARQLEELLHHPRLHAVQRAELYFVGLPQLNRFFGHPEWTHDEWLYGQFERLRAAPPRSIWLRPALTTGPVRLVIVPKDPPFAIPLNPPVVPGLTETLLELGYDRTFSVGRFEVWEKRRRPVTLLPRA